MKAFKYILFLLLIGLIGTAIYIAVQPNEFAFSRSKVINAPASIIYNKVNDFKNWPDFSPWIEQEPNATLTYGETTSGVDGNYAWNGEILGEGSMNTLAVDANKSINQHISFIKPFESESDIDWSFESTNEGTKVTWSMNGKQDFMTKMYTTFAGSIEETTGPDFERGLFKLDSIVTADMNKFSISIEAGEKVAIIGPNGIGKTTLLRCLEGTLGLDSGDVKWTDKAQIGSYAQDHAADFEEKSSLTDWMTQWRKASDDDQAIRSVLGRLLFSGDEVKKSVKVISGGEQGRMIFGKLILQKPNVLLMDEPTNHLDMESIESLNAALERFTGTLIFVSHDREFVSSLATRIIELKPDGINDFKGNYEDYLQYQGIQ